MKSFFLKLNADKTQIIVFGPNAVTDKVCIHGTFVGENRCIRFSNTVSNLGVLLDSNLTFAAQVNKTVSAVFLSIKNISRISSFLTVKEKATLVCSLILSKLDYANSLYYGINSNLLSKLQYAQNSAERLVYKRRKHDHVTDVMKDLHWLPVKHRVTYKILLIVHKGFYGNSPQEINDLLIIDSSRTFNLRIDVHKTRYGSRAFSTYAGRVWNVLPMYLKLESNTPSLKKLLKTYLFNLEYIL